MRRDPPVWPWLACAFIGCHPSWPDITFTRVPADSRFGVEFAQGSPLRSGTFATAWNADALYVAILEDDGFDTSYVEQPSQLRVFRIDPSTGASTRLADPPFPPFESEWTWATPWMQAFLGAGVVLGEESSSAHRVLVWENGWRQVDYPSGINVADSIAARPGGEIVLVGGGRAFSWDGSSWGELPMPPGLGGPVLGPWDEAGVRLVALSSGGLIAAPLFDVRARVVKEDGARLAGATRLGFPRFQNGTTADFRFDAWVAGVHRVVRFLDGAFVPGPALATDALVLDTPGAPVFGGVATGARSLDHTSFGPFFRVGSDDSVLLTAAQPHALVTTCPCERGGDPTCQCLPRDGSSERQLMQETRMSPDGQALGVVFGDTADGVRRYSVRRLDLPFSVCPLDEPFSAP